jgi:hypothetical protein
LPAALCACYVWCGLAQCSHLAWPLFPYAAAGAGAACSIEEERFFPFVEQHARMPLLFSEQHGVLDDSLDLCHAAIANMAATGTAARDAQLLSAFKVRGLCSLLPVCQTMAF